MITFFEAQMLRYAAADAETKRASKEHWLQVYADNINSGSDTLLSARVLANMALVDSGKYEIMIQ